MAWKARVFDPRLKLDVLNGNMPAEFKDVITASNINKWKKEKWSNLIGYNYYTAKEYDLRILQESIKTQEQEIKKLKAENEVITLAIKIGSISREFERTAFKNKSQLIDCVEKNKKIFSVKKFSKLLNLNKNTYYEWKQLNKKECEFSKNFICVKRHPNRISIEEEEAIVELLRDERYEHFPLSSLIWMARYNNLVFAGRPAWDRIRKENFIKRKKIKKTRKKYYQALIAEYANQYLHADVTYFKIDGGKTYFIYIVKDNFSKYIKSWAISDTINPDTRIDTFKLALHDIEKGFDYKITFITDYGNENRANKVLDFFDSLENVEINFARRDVPFSNSMIERFNHDLKYMYLYKERIKSLRDLKKFVEIAVKEHNYTKRMERLNGQTPYEVYNGIPPKSEWILEQWREARKNRKNKLDALICCLGEVEKFKQCLHD